MSTPYPYAGSDRRPVVPVLRATVGSSRRRAWLGNLALLAATCVLLLAVAELLIPRFVQLEKVSLVYDSLLGFRGRPNLTTHWIREMNGSPRIVRTNRFGFHDTDHGLQTPPGTRRIVFLGDSFLEAYQVEIADNFCSRVGRRLNERRAGGDPPAETVNLGVHGYGLGSYYLFVRDRLAAWNPDMLVLVIFLGNDLRDNFGPFASSAVPRFRLADGRLAYEPAPPYTAKTWVRDHILARSNLARLVWMYALKGSPRLMKFARAGGLVSSPSFILDTDEQVREMCEVARRLLSEIGGMARREGLELLVYVIPDPIRVERLADPAHARTGLHAEAYRRNRELQERSVIECLEEEKIPYVFPRDLIVERVASGEEIYLGGYGHFSVEGHELSAEVLEPQVRKALETLGPEPRPIPRNDAAHGTSHGTGGPTETADARPFLLGSGAAGTR
jgi:hypothetical protein